MLEKIKFSCTVSVEHSAIFTEFLTFRRHCWADFNFLIFWAGRSCCLHRGPEKVVCNDEGRIPPRICCEIHIPIFLVKKMICLSASTLIILINMHFTQVNIPLDPHLFEMISSSGVDVDLLQRRQSHYLFKVAIALLPGILILWFIREAVMLLHVTNKRFLYKTYNQLFDMAYAENFILVNIDFYCKHYPLTLRNLFILS